MFQYNRTADNRNVQTRAETSRAASPQLSVVIPLFEELETLPELYRRLKATLPSLAADYEVIFVDDGSRDGTARFLREIASRDSHLTVIELSRNFGHQVAICAGLDESRGATVAVMDGDLQDPPEVLPLFLDKLREGYDVVYAIREKRKESWLQRASYALFYRLLKRIASIDIPLDAGDFCVMKRRMVDMLAAMPERNRFLRGIRSWVGMDQVGLAYERHARFAGKPKYTFARLIYLALDGLVSFSYLPLRAITTMGLGISMISIGLAAFYTIKRITIGLNPPGFATVTVALFFLSGVQLITIGVIGEYVGRIFEEVKQRPLYLVRRITRGTECAS